jgi:hypothetical protein
MPLTIFKYNQAAASLVSLWLLYSSTPAISTGSKCQDVFHIYFVVSRGYDCKMLHPAAVPEEAFE